MTEWLIHTFVKDYNETHRSDVRFSYSRLSGTAGILCNLLLFLIKTVTGMLSGSTAVLSDAVNNLTDCFSCIVSLIGNKVASRPADHEHPFGHGRMEYVVSLATAALIISAAFELLFSAVGKILHPSPIRFSWLMTGILASTILVKLWMARFNRMLGERLDHTGMKAAAEDSRNDVLATALTLGSMILAKKFPGIPLDGAAGAIIAVYIGWSGIQLCREIIGKLLGNELDETLREQIMKLMQDDPNVLGVHDLVIHDYGTGNRMGSVHAELRADMSLREAHAIIDGCERRVEQELHVVLTVHPDPAETDAVTEQWKEKTADTVKQIVSGATIHDFQIHSEPEGLCLKFDINLPYECSRSAESIREETEKILSKADPHIRCEITVDRGYFRERSE